MASPPSIDLPSLAELAGEAAAASAGGKGAALARLLAAGLPVPPGFVVPAAAYREAVDLAGPTHLADAPLVPALAAAIDRAGSALGDAAGRPARFVVRSSATCEDGSFAAPGIFSSRRDVPLGPALHDAVRAVWASLHTPLAAAFLAARGETDAAMAVIVQLQAPGATATMYTRPPGDPSAPHMLFEATGAAAAGDGELALIDRATLAQLSTHAPSGISAAALAEAGRLALAAEHVIGAPADVELVIDAAALVWVVQARAIAGARPADPRDADFARGAAGAAGTSRLWTWDATHNPEPLSPAQAGLVELVEAEGAAPIHQRVVCGFLYTSPGDHTAPGGIVGGDVEPVDLRRVYESELRPALSAALAAIEEAPDLSPALAGYLDFYRLYAWRLSPAIARARRALPELLARDLGWEQARARAAELIGGVPSPLAALPAGERRRALSALSPSWDVATPTYGETPDLLAGLVARIADHGSPATAGWGGLYHAPLTDLAGAVAIARDAAALAEEDDLLFARAQAGVRRALIAVAARWGAAIDDVMHLPLPLAGASAPPADLAARAAAARAERERWRGYVPPPHILAGRPVRDPRAVAPGEHLIRGRAASPGRARGRVERDPAAAGGKAFAVPAIVPGLAPLLAATPPVALLAERGGILGHGAALARALGVPCVIAPELRDLPSGAEVLVDGDLGLVIRL